MNRFVQTKQYLLVLLLSLGVSSLLLAEGSKDFVKYQGKRLFLLLENAQQMKVYAKAGEIINVGSSHVGISGGFITVYKPSGEKVAMFDGADGKTAIINNNVEEMAGPIGNANGGYEPGTVTADEEGVYTVLFEFPSYEAKVFKNLENNQPWTRAVDQPTIRRVAVAWDVTVSTAAALADGSNLLKGRVYSQDYNSIVNENGSLTSPTYFILSKDGYIYQIDFKDVDPWGFPILANSLGIVNSALQPQYQSQERSKYVRSDDPTSWAAGSKYFYEPQAPDYGPLINHKVFFNMPDTSLPAAAKVSYFKREGATWSYKKTYNTWLLTSIPDESIEIKDLKFIPKGKGAACDSTSTIVGQGGYLTFTSNGSATVAVRLDLNNDGDYDDVLDRTMIMPINVGKDTIYWDGKYGDGTDVPANTSYKFGYNLQISAGEIHIMMNDVENNPGGTVITRINGLDSPSKKFYYDHSLIGGAVSGGGTAGSPRSTETPYTYSGIWGDNKLLDYWANIEFDAKVIGGLTVAILTDCNNPPAKKIDSDKDGVADEVDLDDDNDGVTDLQEYCNPNCNFACLPNALDPSGDEDKDGVPNYKDVQATGCSDGNADGICDNLLPEFDTDGDGVPDHLDLDSDNDGLTDLYESGYLTLFPANVPDTLRNGVIDGVNAKFGINGLFDFLDSAPTSLTAVGKYKPWDWDKDGVPDHDDLDSDNDGITDVAEAGYSTADINGDGRIDVTGALPVDANGLPKLPITSTTGIPDAIDFDKDGVPDWHDLDSDNDGINDVLEASVTYPDPDDDGIIGQGKPVVNKDGVATGELNGVKLNPTSNPIDTDKDGVPDWHDLDSDNDKINDVLEGGKTDPDKDGIVGVGKPTVNTNGQPQPSGSTSKVPDFDKDGIPDFRDTKCDIALEQPRLTTNSPVCDGDEIYLFVQQTYNPIEKYVWLNGKGDTIVNNQRSLTMKTDNPKAISPFSVSVSGGGCVSALSLPASVSITRLPSGAEILARPDAVIIPTGKAKQFSVISNDVLNVDSWNITITKAPTKGTVTEQNGYITYTPNSGATGADEMEYNVCFSNCSKICSSATITINIGNPTVSECFIPNMLTPNGDGANDALNIPCAEDNPNNQIMVFNRWGDKVYEKKGYANDWNGTYNGDLLPAGTYFYLWKLDEASSECKSGYITILRN